MKSIGSSRLRLVAILLVAVAILANVGTIESALNMTTEPARLPSPAPARNPATSEGIASAPSGPVLWSANFESGDASTYFNVPNPSNQQVCPNSNNPGVVESSNVHTGSYAGYYSSDGSATSSCRSYWNVQFGGGGTPVLPAITTHDFYVEGWFYVPSTTLTSWVSFITLAWASSGQPDLTIDSNPAAQSGRVLYIHDVEWTSVGSSNYYRQTNPITWPFDTWFKIGFEVHLKPAPQTSTYTVYQNDVAIISASLTIDPSYTTIPNLHHMHFGLYMGTYNGAYNSHWSVYNDDIVLEDLSGAPATSTSATSARSTTSSSTSRTTTSSTGSQTTSSTTNPTTSTRVSTITSVVTSTVTSGASTTTQTSIQTSTQTLTQTSATTGVTPTITLSPASTTVGSTVLVSGSGFSANDASCSLSGGAVGTSSCSVSGGSLAGAFLVANVVAGSYTITARGSPGADSATVNFQVLTSGPIITLNPASASVGSTVTFSGSGFSTSDTICSLSGIPVGTVNCLISGGTLTGSFIVANVGSTSYAVTAVGNPSGDSASTALSVLSPSIILNPSFAQPGATVAVSGSGFYTTDTTCSFSGGAVAAQTCSISGGSLTGSFTVANTGSGSYLITVTTSGADSGSATAYLQVASAVTTTTTTSTSFGTSTSTRFSATTTTFTLTGIFTTESVSSTTVTVMGQSTASLATASTITSFVTASSTTTLTETSVTTHNLITGGMVAPSFGASNSGQGALGLLAALLMLVPMVLRKMYD